MRLDEKYGVKRKQWDAKARQTNLCFAVPRRGQEGSYAGEAAELHGVLPAGGGAVFMQHGRVVRHAAGNQ